MADDRATAARDGQPKPTPNWYSPREILGVLLDAAKQWQADNAMRLSAAVAMYSILSLAPLLVITIRVMSLILSEQAATRQVEYQVQTFLGPSVAAAVNDMVLAAGRNGDGAVATLISVGILLFTASGVFVELRDSLNNIWGITPDDGWGWFAAVRDRLLSIGMVFVIGFLLLVSQVVTTTLTVLTEYVVGGAGWVAVLVDLFVSTLIVALLFAMIFRFLADARLTWRDVAFGAFITAILFKVGQYLQALYFTHISTGSAYGAAGSFVVILLWVYYSCWILFYGAELIQARANRMGRRIAPAENARETLRGDPHRPEAVEARARAGAAG
jgi:membrane protein